MVYRVSLNSLMDKIIDSFCFKMLLIVSLAISFLNDINVFKISKIFTYGFLILWILIAFIKLFLQWNTKKILEYLKVFFVGNFVIKIIIYIYTIFLILLGLSETRFLSSNMETFVNALSAISIVYIFGKNSLKCSISAICLSFLIALVGTIFMHGLYFYKELEFHDLAFSGGYILIYLFFASKQWIKRNLFSIVFIATMILVAFKRIGIAALVFVIIYYIILKRFDRKTIKKILYATSLMAIILSYLYVYLIISGRFVDIINFIGDFTSGRYYYYQVAEKISKFNIGYLGLGRNAMAVLFSQEYSYFHVGNIHSDILRMYLECGFIIFGLWLGNYFIFFPKMIQNKFGMKTLELYMLCTIYNFIIYSTDNTELYIANQYFYMLIPMYYALKTKKIFKLKRMVKNETVDNL